MLSERRSRDHLQQPPRSPHLAPKHASRPPHPARALTPSRIEERVASSPLRQPLQNAIYHTARDRSNERHSQSRSRVVGRCSVRECSRPRRGLPEEGEGCERYANAETQAFLRKYFEVGSAIAVGSFIDCVLLEYRELFEGQEWTDYIMGRFEGKVGEMFGEAVEPRRLLALTEETGMLGFIIEVFKIIQEEPSTGASTAGASRTSGLGSGWQTVSHSPYLQSINRSFEEQLGECGSLQGLKDIIQEFMELMYNQMEGEIYKKFNLEMRRMVIKHKETERMLKKAQDTVTHHADYFEAQKNWKEKARQAKDTELTLRAEVARLAEELKAEKAASAEARTGRERLEEENARLRESVEKYQNVLLSKFEGSVGGNSEYSLPSLQTLPASRRVPGTPLQDRTQEFQNFSPYQPAEPKPFQVKIDTQFIHRDNAPPLTQTTTTFHEPTAAPTVQVPNFGAVSSYSPIKRTSEVLEGSRPSVEGGGIRPGTKIGDFIYNPIQSRISRPL